jgi:hypothetical protein
VRRVHTERWESVTMTTRVRREAVPALMAGAAPDTEMATVIIQNPYAS